MNSSKYLGRQNCQDVSSFQTDLEIQCNPSQNPSKACWGYLHTDSKVYIEKIKIQSNQHNIEEVQSWRTDIIQLQDL